jgi:phospholipid/cholesterol/gamma-HCH transport system substrate-binding protein
VRARQTEICVGLFMLAGILALLVLALKVSGLSTTLHREGYTITAHFDNVGDLKVRAPVTMAGVHVGQVTNIKIDKNTYKAIVTMQIDANQNKIPQDSAASIFTQGLLGANYISLSPGYENKYLVNGARIENTHPALILEDLIGQLLFSLKDKNTSDS